MNCGTCGNFCLVPGDEENRNSKGGEEMGSEEPADAEPDCAACGSDCLGFQPPDLLAAVLPLGVRMHTGVLIIN